MTTQISANISPETRELLERYVATHGVKKSHLIETAVLHHLKALDEIPADLHISPEISITRQSGERLIEVVEKPKRPTKAMRELYRD